MKANESRKSPNLTCACGRALFGLEVPTAPFADAQTEGRLSTTAVLLGRDKHHGFGVQRCGSFIEHNNARVLENRPSSRNTLLFAIRKSQATIPDFGRILIRESHEFVVNAGRATSIVDR
jgi:hypothetical protein